MNGAEKDGAARIPPPILLDPTCRWEPQAVYMAACGRHLMDGIGQGLLVLVIIVLVGVSLWWHFSRSLSMVEQWARDNGLTLVEVERRYMFHGPFWWRTGKGQAVFRVTVRDGSGQVRSGYVRVGGWFLGLLSDQVTVEWEE